MRRTAIVAACMLIATVTGSLRLHAQELAGVSEANLEKAQVEIAAMGEPELRSLLRYLAECRDRDIQSVLLFQGCRIARVRYQIEFENGRAIDAAINDSEKLLGLRRLLDGGTGGIPPETARTDAKLREAVNAAFRAKRKQ